jgi:hypothetical protein
MVRCIHAACGQALPRRVNFCPYCGTAQGEAGITRPHRAPVSAAPPAAEAPARVSLERPERTTALAAAATATSAAAAAAAAAPEVRAAAPETAAVARPDAPVPSSSRPAPAPAASPRAQTIPPRVHVDATPGAPPKREPVRLRWWLLALAALWAIWLIAKPSNRRIEAQMDKAIALATECKPREAQSELIALRGTKATPEQLQRVQKSLNEASAACTRKRQRDKAWREAKAGVDAALAGSAVERARSRLRAFTKRWGEDDATRAAKQEIDARQPEHRRADEVEEGMMR